MRALILAAAVILAGCQPRTVFVPVALYAHPAPVLPTVRKAELECLDDDVAQRIEDRDDLRRVDQAKLRAIIDSTHQ